MNKITKNLATLVIISTSTLCSMGCNRKTDSSYKSNPQSQEQIVNSIILSRERDNLSYSRETIDNFYNVLKKEIKNNPELMEKEIIEMTQIGLDSDYSGKIIASLSFKEKMRIAKECSLYEARGIAQEVKENITKLDEKLEESQPGLIKKINSTIKSGLEKANVPEAAERVKRDAGRFYKNVKERTYGN